MSLKFAALGGLLSVLGTRARAGGRAQNPGPVRPHHEPIFVAFGLRIIAAEPQRPEPRGVMMKLEARGTTGGLLPRKSLGIE
jgi:hypothetical protein